MTRRRAAPLLAAALIAVGTAGDAYGSVARVVQTCVSNRYTSYCYYNVHVIGGAAERNAIAVRLAGEDVFVRDDGAPLEAGSDCDALDDGGVVCPRLQGGVKVNLGDGDDSLVLEEPGCAQPYGCSYVTADGGPGADVLTGGAARDTLTGGDGPDELHGGASEDRLYDGDPQTSVSSDLLDGGDGFDYALYDERTEPTTIDLGSGAAGSRGENDRLTAVEGAIGGRGDDLLLGDDAEQNVLDGSFGDDVLRGRGGTDRLIGHDGSDRLAGGTDDDSLEPSAMPSYIGDFAPHADGVADRVSCGTGEDMAQAVRYRDILLAGCERAQAYWIANDLHPPTHELAGELAAPGDPVARFVGVFCEQRPCSVRFRLVLVRRVADTPAGTVVGGREIALRRRDNPPIAVRLNRVGRDLLARHDRLRTRIRVSRYADEPRTGFAFETRLE